jgi:hypothetical protein
VLVRDDGGVPVGSAPHGTLRRGEDRRGHGRSPEQLARGVMRVVDMLGGDSINGKD